MSTAVPRFPSAESARIRALQVLAVCSTVLLAGCMSPKMYADTQYRSATYDSIARSDNPRPVTLTVEFQLNGRTYERAQPEVEGKVARVLEATGVFRKIDSAAGAKAGQLQITINDTANMPGAFGKGFLTGLTFGLVGCRVSDNYRMTAIYTPAGGGAPITKQYKHALHSTVGLHAAPKGMERVPTGDAADRVIEDMMLNFLRDCQTENVLQNAPGTPTAQGA